MSLMEALPVVAVNGTTAPPVETPEVFAAFNAAYERMRAAGKLQYTASLNVRALAELLVDKGLVTSEEITAAREAAAERVNQTFVEAGLGVALAETTASKYELAPEDLPDIDCADRMPLCHAACCTMRWALSEEDVVEGVVQWELTKPYANRVRADGWCAHCDPETKACGIYEQRPVVCRTYDCRKDRRIWVDFEARIINPNLLDDDGRVRKPMVAAEP